MRIENAGIVLENGVLHDGVILTDGARIRWVGARKDAPASENETVVDAGGLFVGPGFVDLHVHAAGKTILYREPLKSAAYYLRHGTTTLLVTHWYRWDREEHLKGCDNVRAAMRSDGVGRCIAGMYMEGPYINAKYGSSARTCPWNDAVRPEDYEAVVDRAGDLVKIWMVAPEREGILDFVKYAKKINPAVRFAVGHSEATPEQIAALKPYGLSQLTHCMNATGRTTSWKGTRGCGPDEACFLDPDMYAELISDSGAVHVSAPLQRLILQNKGVDRLILITDGSVFQDDAPAELLARYGDLHFNAEGDLAGSRLTMETACRNFRKHTGCDMAQTFLAASRNPARAIGLDGEIGTVAAGKKANLVFVDESFHVHKVMLEGELQTESEERE